MMMMMMMMIVMIAMRVTTIVSSDSMDALTLLLAGCKSSLTGDDYYGAYDAQNTAIANADKIGVVPVPSLNLVYTEEESYVTAEYAKEKG